MQGDLGTIRCEDCKQAVPLDRARMAEGGLLCVPCAVAREQLPPIVMPVWTRLRRAVGIGRN